MSSSSSSSASSASAHETKESDWDGASLPECIAVPSELPRISSPSEIPPNLSIAQVKERAWLLYLTSIAARTAQRATRFNIHHRDEPVPRMALCLYASFEVWKTLIDLKAGDFDDTKRLQTIIEKARPQPQLANKIVRFRVDGGNVVHIFINVIARRAMATGDAFHTITPEAHQQAATICKYAFYDVFTHADGLVLRPTDGCSTETTMISLFALFVADYHISRATDLVDGEHPQQRKTFLDAVRAVIDAGWRQGIAELDLKSEKDDLP
jgi:hypothetical protein